ncbi:unnamed protein product [Eruca vesicaria subsp. sativa]|uniref:DUF6821 domain-containing protein n=1 Tax=Eruca vesicaria subsp. sativa TaxID=29727 RepID=A0ABC8IRT4_ERUVS|nr:unnamed protein product [Eruca vesicaria subsp. sativa]
MDAEELLDWELVHGSDTESITSEKQSGSSSVIDDGMILSDHFSTDHLLTTHQSLRSSGVVHWSGDTGARNELGFTDCEIKVSDFQASDEEEDVEGEAVASDSHIEDVSKCLSETDQSQAGVEEHIEDSSKSLSNELVSGDSGIVSGEEEIVSDSEAVEGSGGDTLDSAVRSGDESKRREIVWWKMPFVLVKYYAFRIGPVWSVSMAAAVMGFVLLGRRLYHMKKKAQRFHLKVAIDEKKVSRVMSQAARLNEAFTEVRRVPVIRPALPSPGAWPVLSLR